ARRPRRRRDRQSPPAPAGRLHPTRRERHLLLGPAPSPGPPPSRRVGAAGAQEVLLPIAQPLDLWARTGRDATYGPLMFRLEDRKEAGFCLSPTAEEVITSLGAGEYSSYRDLPVNLYQINWKYRDELRPRFGLLRAREFLMKDAYSFHVDTDDLRRTYQDMYDAYQRVFTRC